MSTATRVTEWTRTWVDDEGVAREYRLPVQVNQHAGDASLWRVSPPIDGHDHILICDRGALLHEEAFVAALDLMSGGEMSTFVASIVEVFAAAPDGTVESMSALRQPVSLNRTRDGIDVTQILAALGYATVTSST